ncbi:hypothetical protein PSECIP111951_00948 [Pseudoalteromonas holothuriae]|uniref:Fido domain-containing protein n=1 Tax=Pseudoalteromonas holothuriae TaxID=2963714 RepID=A0ABM9GFA8_9GAMM|nr:Fic family protein [Pseudoalteromonas sp. CIP111951]CAH9054050.1 hypothetical protein PSECIP111951_00948 [Pseudoalteromonas sp. CIP111951]
MAKPYTPPFTLTPKIINLLALISEQVGRLSAFEEKTELKLRRINQIKTIQGSLAIEGNTLSEEQITAILAGKPVIAPPKDILEAKNAIAAYECFANWQPSNTKHLLNAHQILMQGLIDDAGNYRSGNVGVMKGSQVVHMAPQAERVPALMLQLLDWLKTTDQHPLIKSCVFHYEFEFIHPFSDGNGRMGRLWQTLILNQWQPILGQLPVESIINNHQDEYYQVINASNLVTDSAPFIEFMMQVILETLQDHGGRNTPQAPPQVTPQVEKLLLVLDRQSAPVDRISLQQALKLKDRKSFQGRYIKPALELGLIAMTLPDKPTSSLQRYMLSEAGKELANRL